MLTRDKNGVHGTYISSTSEITASYSIANFNFNFNFNFANFNVAAIKYSFAQADEIVPKINALKQYYVRKQELLYFRLCIHEWCNRKESKIVNTI